MGFAEPPSSRTELVSSYLTVSPLPRIRIRGGLLSVALSPDRSGPPLTAIPPCGVRTFLPACARHAERLRDLLRCAARGSTWTIDYALDSSSCGSQNKMR